MTSIKTGKHGGLTAEQREKLSRLAAQQIGYLVFSGRYRLIEADASDAPTPVAVLDDAADVDTVIEAILAVGRERKQLLDALHAALSAQQHDVALALARQLCNLQKGGNRDAASQETVH